MRKIILLFFISISLFLNTACWDKHEIEDRAYILTIGIDNIEDEKDNFEVTYEYANLRAVGKNGQGEPKFIISKKGRSIPSINRDLGTISEKDIFFNHLKVIVIGEELARDKIKMTQIIQFFNRSPNIGRKVVMLIAEGNAKDILNTEMKDTQIFGTYISELRERKSIGGKYYVNTFNDLLSNTFRTDIALVGRITKDKDGAKVAGSSIIKDKKLITFLTEKDTSTAAILILTNEIYNDQIIIDKNNGKYLVNYIAQSYDTQKDLKIEDGDIKISFNIEVEGYINEYIDEDVGKDSDILDDKKIKKVQKEINNKIEDELNDTIDKLQNEIGVDVIQIEKYIREKEPTLWEKVKDNWDNEFQKIDFTVNIDSKIRRTGLSE